MRAAAAMLLAALAAGCATIERTDVYHGRGIGNGERPLETIEIENTGWLLFKCIPLGSGNPARPNSVGCRLFRNTVTLQNNLDMLAAEMERVGAARIVNLSSRKTDETIFVILLTRHACHTSAVLLKPRAEQ